MTANYLFVYGWLKTRYRLALGVRNISEFSLEYLGRASIRGSLFRVAEYPGFSRVGQQNVVGELYKVPEYFDWKNLDKFEHAYPLIRKDFEYRRVVMSVLFQGKSVQAFLYEYAGTSRGALIDSGEF